MEPCLFRHGKVEGRPANPPGSQLQWSHVFSDMVSDCHNFGRKYLYELQWSHVFSDMVRVVKAL